jgi:hypothetical protein
MMQVSVPAHVRPSVGGSVLEWARRRGRILVIGALAVLAVAGPTARADDKVDQANAQYRGIPKPKRSDLILLPALAAVQAPPAALLSASLTSPRDSASEREAMRLPAGAQGWTEVEAWAMAPSQRAALDALKAATTDDDSGQRMAFGQPYGIEGVPLDLVRAGLYTELGDPPMLAGSRFQLIDPNTPGLSPMDRLVALGHVEATRLAAAGNVQEAMDVLLRLLYIGRQFADRAFVAEVDWGLRRMISALQRVRDVAYTDSRGAHVLDEEKLMALVKRLDDKSGFLRTDRLVFPNGDRYAAEQVVARVFQERGGPNDQFAQTMAHLGATQFPLRLFSEEAKWQNVAAVHHNWFDTIEALDRVASDWSSRWNLSPFDTRMSEPHAFETLSSQQDAVLLAVFNRNTRELFGDRQMLQAEAVGTRMSLGVLAYTAKNRVFPPQLSSIRPQYVKELEADPYNPSRDRGAKPPLEYFVPIRDQKFDPREDPYPHTINVIVLSGRNFDISIGQDQFILYSVGPDGVKNWASVVREDARDLYQGDYLIWPPTISLERQHKQDAGEIR